jgi:glycosyltransferase involved in cell wall biosynthesis
MPGWIRGPHFVVDPRGFRAYVQTESFFRAAPRVLDDVPDAEFAGVGMMDVPEALRWAEGLHLGDRMRLLPSQDAAGMAALFRGAAVSVSPSVHDGTPNTLLEAMACGCLPVAGDLESIREWIVDGDNGLLVDPRRPNDLARAIVRALKDDAWRSAAAGTNLQIIAERADRRQGMQRAERFYRELTT